jgi:hypothetical protein
MGGTHDIVNAWIDDLLAVGSRLLGLPLFMLLLAGVVVAAGLAVAMRRKRWRGRLLVAEALLLFFAAVFAADRKIARLQDQVNDLRARNTAEAAARVQSASARPAMRQNFHFNLDRTRAALTPNFAEVVLQPVIYDQATDIISVSIGTPPARAYAAVIDLTYPGLGIQVGGSLQTKTLTSEFARENQCTVAINGEAGMSPDPDAALGWYRGDMVQRGSVLSREYPPFPMPFIYFDRDNRAGFVSGLATARTITPRMFNLVWGRLDSIVSGQVKTQDERNSQPRTAMGINQDGSILYLLVVDGRQPRYSMGFTRAQVGQFLLALGAWNAMLCDEGGSSCMFVRRFGGICDIPSDGPGVERPTYTHFGITLGDGGGF